jgi:GR25 family glycosyltransferase involved in LPS biosynthesis
MGKIHKHGYDYAGKAINNLYNFLLQREPDKLEYDNYIHHDFNDVVRDFLQSEEYHNLIKNKFLTASLNKKINYTVLKINDRAIDTLKDLHSKLNNVATYHEIKSIDYNLVNIKEFFKKRNISINWLGDLFGLSPTTTDSELAVTASHIFAMEYLLENNLDELIVFEDDVILSDNFVNLIFQCFNDVPKDYDFLADCTLLPNYEEFSTEEHSIKIDSEFICKANLQNSHTGFMMYSKKGAKKILDIYKKKGIICAIDTFLFWLNRRKDLNAYTTYYSNKLIKEKDIYGSIVTNKRLHE